MCDGKAHLQTENPSTDLEGTTATMETKHEAKAAPEDTGAALAQEVAEGQSSTEDNAEEESLGTESESEDEIQGDDNIPQYSDLFPPLPTAGPKFGGALPSFRPVKITTVFHMDDMVQQQGKSPKRQTKIAQIMADTNTAIELSLSKGDRVTFMITGRASDVTKAKRQLQTAFQAQKTVELEIPQEHHAAIIGRGGEKLRELCNTCAVKINMPKKGEVSDTITVIGAKENVEKAVHEMQLISEERAKNNLERVNVEKVFQPFVFGPNKVMADKLVTHVGGQIKIHIPPFNVQSDQIVVVGEKAQVTEAVRLIKERTETKKTTLKMLTVNVPKDQHRWVVGPRGRTLEAIFNQTGVLVEMPPADSDSESLTLRGDGAHLVKALAVVMEKATSMCEDDVDAPRWLHKYIIGPKGATIRNINEDQPEVRIDFSDSDDVINLQGPPAHVEAMKAKLQEYVQDLLSKKTRAELHIHPSLHRHLIGKAGQTIKRIRDESEVDVTFPEEDESDLIVLEGPHAGVAKAKAELEALAKKHNDTIVVEVEVPQKFHGNIIGKRGDNAKKIVEAFNGIQMRFPGATEKSDKIRLTGLTADVTACADHIKKMAVALMENNYTLNVIVFRQYHKNIIGKGGLILNKIRKETNTRITVPLEGEERDSITVVGKKADVLKAQEMILKIQSELVKISVAEVPIEHRLHAQIIGPKGALVRSIAQDCNNVLIDFPKEGAAKQDVVTIRGPHDDVDKAKKLLLQLATEKALTNHVEELVVSNDMFGYLIGKGGVNKRKIQDECSVRILFPNKSDEDSNTVTIIGRKSDTAKAKLALLELVKEYGQVVTVAVPVAAKYQGHLLSRNGEALRDLGTRCPDVTITLPKGSVAKDSITLKGPEKAVDACRELLLSIVDEQASKVTEKMKIEGSMVGAVIGKGGSNIRGLQEKHGVEIKMPRGGDEEEDDGLVRISGRKEHVEACKQDILKLIPITLRMYVPAEFHGGLIGAGGKGIRELQDNYNVNLKFPSAKSKSSEVVLTGTEEKVEEAQKYIEERIKELEAEKKEREARNFRLEVAVDRSAIPRIIGRSGATINKIRDETGCRIDLPVKKSSDSEEDVQVNISIIGYRASCEAAQHMIEELISEPTAAETLQEGIQVDRRVHGRLIGAKGAKIVALQKELKVRIDMPRDKSSDIIVLKGSAANVEIAKEHILNLAEEYMLDIDEDDRDNRVEIVSQHFKPTRSNEEPQGKGKGDTSKKGKKEGNTQKEFKVAGAPWQQPAPSNPTTFGIALTPTAPLPTSSAWSKKLFA
eukprot:comp24051_c0_seq1/m.43173 comp24051_c0_seq1/g.43173  ORF comp24051_c0_seq1/g.43173 comp24051_c0_seq1/m.43173 type:complete len:1290 (-) comp24051_c0_seq1:407-4276(-)